MEKLQTAVEKLDKAIELIDEIINRKQGDRVINRDRSKQIDDHLTQAMQAAMNLDKQIGILFKRTEILANNAFGPERPAGWRLEGEE